MNPANSAGFVAHVTQIKASHMAHTFLVADELEYGKVLQYVKDDDAKNLVLCSRGARCNTTSLGVLVSYLW